MKERNSIIDFVELKQISARTNVLSFLSQINDTFPEQNVHARDWEIYHLIVVDIQGARAVLINLAKLIVERSEHSVHLIVVCRKLHRYVVL
jgi:hypothetical protein